MENVLFAHESCKNNNKNHFVCKLYDAHKQTNERSQTALNVFGINKTF